MSSPTGATSSPFPMLPVPEALAVVLAQTPCLPEVEVPLAEAGGRIVAAHITASDALPPFAASVKDGYAVVAADGPGEYPIVGEALAGALADFVVQPGTVAYITTGAPMPDGADAVVMVEETEPIRSSGDPTVRIKRGVQRGDDVRQVGVDVQPGQVLLSSGERLGAAEIGLLATAGFASVPVHGRPHVAVLSTGDELAEPGAMLKPGQIRDSNRYMLMEAIRAVGAVPIDLGVARDAENELTDRMEKGLKDADVVVTSGGVSMGDLDLVKPLLERKGTLHFGRILMKPGKPLTFATVEQAGATKLVFGLPGNPVSSLVTFHLFVVPALRKMMGFTEPELPRVQAHLAQSLSLDPERPEYHRATLTWDGSLNSGAGGYLATSTGSQASSRLLSMRTANALLELPASDEELAVGTVVDALLIGSLG
jgi:gephyrin